MTSDRLLDIPAAAEFLGFSVWTLYRWVERERLPHLRIGRQIRFRRHELEAWAESQRRGPRLEVSA